MSALSFDQSEEENRDAFVQRLIEAGWTRDQALDEWKRIQTEEE